MDKEAIIEKLIDGIMALNVTIKREDISRERGLIESGALDSYGFVEFTGYIEQTFGVTIADADMNQANFSNIEAVAAMVESKLSR